MRYTLFGATYDCGAYGAGSYQNNTCASSGGGSTSGGASASGSSGILTNTGFDILLIATIAAALIFAALVVRFWRRPRKKNRPSS